MNKSKVTLLSMLVISSIFCISCFLGVHFPLRPITAHSLEDDNKITTTEKITEESSEEAIISLFSYNIDTSDEVYDNYNIAEYDENDTSENNESEAPLDSISLEGSLSQDSDDSTQSYDNSADEAIQEYIRKYAQQDEEQLKEAHEYITELKSKIAAEEKEAAKYANIGISMAKEYVNIRKKPTTDSESLGKLYRHSACKIINESDGWYYVESGNVCGYVKAEYIQTGIPYKELIEKYGTKKARVIADGLNVRKEPSTESEKLTVLYNNEKYSIIDTVDDWYKVEVDDENIKGYVKAEYVDLIVTFKEAVSKAEEAKMLELKAEERAKKETAIKYRDDFNYTAEDLKLLACLIHAEAGTQSYEGKLAVANVVLNRVKSSKYPNTIKGVIYQPGQFSVARSGSLQKQLDNYNNFKSTSQKMSIKAAKDALEGANNIGSRLYFHSYKAASKKGYTSKKNSVKIDDHLFW